MSQPANFSVSWSAGPTLAYVHSEDETVTLVDRISISSDRRRERAICRALLVTALELLDASEPPRTTASEARR